MNTQQSQTANHSKTAAFQSNEVGSREPSTPVYTVKQFSQKHPAFPEGGMRNRIFYQETNGMKKAGAVLRLGRKVLIDEARFFAWIADQNNTAKV